MCTATPVTGRQIRVGIIGAGLIGQTHSMMLRQIAHRTEQSVRVVSVADVSHRAAEQLAARWLGASAFESAEEIIADPSIDAVWIYARPPRCIVKPPSPPPAQANTSFARSR